MVRIPITHRTEQEIKMQAIKEASKLTDTVKPQFLKTLNLMSYNQNWKIKEYFTPLEASILAYGFDPNYFYCALNNIKIESTSLKNSLDVLEKEYHNFKWRTPPQDTENNLFYELDEYQQKMIKMQFLFEIILDGLRFEKIYFDRNKNLIQYVRDYKLVKIHKLHIVNFFNTNNIESDFFETTISNNENDFYKIPKNHKCVSVKIKVALETLLHFIENEQDLHDAKSGVSDAITKQIQDNNTYKISETSIKKEITPILNWTHQKELEKLK